MKEPLLCTKASQNQFFDDFLTVFGNVCEVYKFKKYIDSRNQNYNKKSTILDGFQVQQKQRAVALRLTRSELG